MIGFDIEVSAPDDLVRLVRALGQHRYVASRLHLAHAFALEAIGDEWARDVLADASIDEASKDERLVRRIDDKELVAVLAAFWGDDETARTKLRERIASIDASAEGVPFDDDREDDMFPILVDAGWELLPLLQLDPERHRGAMNAFGEQIAWEVAKFEEENQVPPVPTLHELPLIGAAELLRPLDAPFAIWQQGNETYLDYVLRGALKVAKL